MPCRLPFDPRGTAALWEPEQAEHTSGPWRPAAVPDLPEIAVVAQMPSAAEHVARVTKLVEQLGDQLSAAPRVAGASRS